ncbi:unannotated protein [freshwater metagenome]|uniref:Unannotated protein n=1 Tax=freshwater metagenome TaxID=449393 RepID=A0A6J5YX19_9ZZZZ
MITASVGFQCPECVSRAPANVIKVSSRNSLGSDLPPVTRVIIIVCVGLFIAGNLLGIAAFSSNNLAMQPPYIAAYGQWYRLLTSAFLHGGFLHIGFNMYALYYLGPELERLLGSRRFLALYLFGALGGSVTSYMFSSVNTSSVGASGAIFALMTATIVVGRQVQADTSQILTLFVVNVLIGFASPSIDWRAHLGGAALGAIVASAMMSTAKFGRFASKKISPKELISLLAVAAVLVAATLYRDTQVLQILGAN